MSSIVARSSVAGDAPSVHFSAPSVYFSEGYGTAGLPKGTRWMTLVDAAGRWQLPVVLSPLAAGAGYEAASPYGYSGIHIAPELEATEAAELWAASVAALKAADVVSLFLRFAPFDATSATRSSNLDGLRVRHASDTVLVPTIDETDVWTSMRGRARTSVRKAIANGMSAGLRPASASDIGRDSPFRELYESTMARVSARKQYYFGDDYYQTLLANLGSDLLICSVTEQAGETVASALVMADSEGLHYHLSGSTPAAARLGANNLLVWEILKAGVALGKKRVHLGGGVSPGDSLFAFKSSFGGTTAPFYIGTAVIDAAEYDRLVDSRALELGVSAADLLASEYFPAFRSGVPLNDA